jgi:hypothetical protein
MAKAPLNDPVQQPAEAPEPPAAIAEAPAADAPTPVADALDKTGGENYLIDQMADTLERAKIAAVARTEDLSIRWGAEQVEVTGADGSIWESRFYVARHGLDEGAGIRHGLTVDEAKSALDAMEA